MLHPRLRTASCVEVLLPPEINQPPTNQADRTPPNRTEPNETEPIRVKPNLHPNPSQPVAIAVTSIFVSSLCRSAAPKGPCTFIPPQKHTQKKNQVSNSEIEQLQLLKIARHNSAAVKGVKKSNIPSTSTPPSLSNLTKSRRTPHKYSYGVEGYQVHFYAYLNVLAVLLVPCCWGTSSEAPNHTVSCGPSMVPVELCRPSAIVPVTLLGADGINQCCGVRSVCIMPVAAIIVPVLLPWRI